jgi:4-carboxymuconolactone decarboxylase
MDDVRTKGLARFRELSPAGEDRLRNLLNDTAPWIYHQILDLAFGDLYQRKSLDMKIRQTVSLVALAIGGHEDLLHIHVEIARKFGFTKEELSEIYQQMVPFTGFPAPMLGVKVVKKVFGEA